MSHNIVLSGVRYDDLKLLAEVVKDLSKGTARLVRDQKTFRTFAGQPTTCDHCIVMLGSSHDIGLKKTASGAYNLIYDPFTMDPVFMAKNPVGYSPANYTGSLAQEYLLRAAEIKAAQSGYSTQRISAKNGSVSLVMERAA